MTGSAVAREPLGAAARAQLVEAGFEPDPPADAEAEAAALGASSAAVAAGVRDLRDLPWSSIDNATTRDLDQVEVAERVAAGIRVRIGIADVDAYVARGSAIDRHAALNTTSVYTVPATFNMLPDRLSTDLTSLVGGADRRCVVVEFVVAPDGDVDNATTDAYLATVRNRAQLAYEPVSAWLERRGPLPPDAAGIAEQLELQNEAAVRLRARREARGALRLETSEAVPRYDDAGRLVGLAPLEPGAARDLIEDFMIAANVAMAGILDRRGLPTIRRVVKSPERWPRIVALARREGEALPDEPSAPALARFLERRRAAAPERFGELSLAVVKLLGAGDYELRSPGEPAPGHFGLAVPDYTHATAPNRRFADLVTQRLLKASLAGDGSPYTDDELRGIAARCTERENASRKVERVVNKMAAAALLDGRTGETFDAVVTGVKPGATYVRLADPPVDGRLVRGAAGLDVGDVVRATLLETDVADGFIDFTLASPAPSRAG